MKRIILLSFLGTATLGFAQNNPVDFEPDGFGADWNWATFEAPEGEQNPEFSVVPNISVDDVNGSANVARMVISYPSTESWGQAGCETEHGAGIGEFTITEENSTVSMMVYQEGFASPVALKFATPVGAAFFETIVQNDVADAWFEVEFDMSNYIGHTLPGETDQIIFFPSYGPRETGHTVYFDNVVFGDVETVSTTDFEADGISAFPNPSKDAWNVSSENAPITQVQVFNAIGQVVWSAVPHNEMVAIDASALKPGLYITRIQTANGTSVLKLIKD